jgi:5-methyltetrahydrofolate--homocysteine methyltransferase
MGITERLSQLAQAIIDGKHIVAGEIVRELLAENINPRTILDEGMMAGMEVVGKRFKEGYMFLPHVLISARAMKVAMGVLEPLLAQSSYKPEGKILLGTVKGDVHDIGKNLVGIMLTGAGFKVVDIGVGCSADQFVKAYQEHKPDIVGLSALLTTTMLYMKVVIDQFKQEAINVPVIVGGAPINSRFAKEIGASGTARNAAQSVELVRSLLEGRSMPS